MSKTPRNWYVKEGSLGDWSELCDCAISLILNNTVNEENNRCELKSGKSSVLVEMDMEMWNRRRMDRAGQEFYDVTISKGEKKMKYKVERVDSFWTMHEYIDHDWLKLFKSATPEQEELYNALVLDFFGVRRPMETYQARHPELKAHKKNILNVMLNTNEEREDIARDFLVTQVAKCERYIKQIRSFYPGYEETHPEMVWSRDFLPPPKEVDRLAEILDKYKSCIYDICGSRTPVMVTLTDPNPDNLLVRIEESEGSIRYETLVTDQMIRDKREFLGPFPPYIPRQMRGLWTDRGVRTADMLCEVLEAEYVGVWDYEKGEYLKEPENKLWMRSDDDRNCWTDWVNLLGETKYYLLRRKNLEAKHELEPGYAFASHGKVRDSKTNEVTYYETHIKNQEAYDEQMKKFRLDVEYMNKEHFQHIDSEWKRMKGDALEIISVPGLPFRMKKYHTRTKRS